MGRPLFTIVGYAEEPLLRQSPASSCQLYDSPSKAELFLNGHAAVGDGLGRQIVMRVPASGSLRSSKWPPCRSTIHFAMASPSPVPPVPAFLEGSARKNRSNTCVISSSEIPIPLSCTSMQGAPSVSSSTRRRMRSPGFVYFTALSTRMRTACLSSASSASASAASTH